MAIRTAAQLREVAAHFRELASMGEDRRLQAALRQVAEEFDREAASVVSREGAARDDQPPRD
jgi:hypothetical protein